MGRSPSKTNFTEENGQDLTSQTDREPNLDHWQLSPSPRGKLKQNSHYGKLRRPQKSPRPPDTRRFLLPKFSPIGPGPGWPSGSTCPAGTEPSSLPYPSMGESGPQPEEQEGSWENLPEANQGTGATSASFLKENLRVISRHPFPPQPPPESRPHTAGERARACLVLFHPRAMTGRERPASLGSSRRKTPLSVMPGSAPGLGEQERGHWVGPTSALEKPGGLLRRRQLWAVSTPVGWQRAGMWKWPWCWTLVVLGFEGSSA